MENKQAIFRALYDQLQAMVATCFPKKCTNCGITYTDIEDFLDRTKQACSSASLLENFEPYERSIVDLNRNCECGSTLMVVFPERRDTSKKGNKLRDKFGESLNILVSIGFKENIARTELKKLLNGRKSNVISAFMNKHGEF